MYTSYLAWEEVVVVVVVVFAHTRMCLCVCVCEMGGWEEESKDKWDTEGSTSVHKDKSYAGHMPFKETFQAETRIVKPGQLLKGNHHPLPQVLFCSAQIHCVEK